MDIYATVLALLGLWVVWRMTRFFLKMIFFVILGAGAWVYWHYGYLLA